MTRNLFCVHVCGVGVGGISQGEKGTGRGGATVQGAIIQGTIDLGGNCRGVGRVEIDLEPYEIKLVCLLVIIANNISL